MAHKTAILERHIDVARLFGAYTWDTLPTRYLASYTPGDKLRGMDAVARQRAERHYPEDTARVYYDADRPDVGREGSQRDER